VLSTTNIDRSCQLKTEKTIQWPTEKGQRMIYKTLHTPPKIERIPLSKKRSEFIYS